MTSKLRLLPLTLVAFAAMAFVACGGSKESEPPAAPTESPAAADVNSSANGNSNGSAKDDLFVSNGADVLGRSSTAFASADVHSFTGQTTFNFKLGGTKMTMTSTFASEDPDRFYMEMSIDGGESMSLIPLGDFGNMKMLARDDALYMNLFGGWMSFSPEELGADQAEIDQMMNSGSMFDYASFVNNGANVTYIDDEDVNGHSTARYRFQGTLGELLASFSDAVGSGTSSISSQLPGEGRDTPVTIDIWIGKEDFLPYKLAMTASANTADGQMELTGEGTFDGYNEPVSIPEAPEDAVSFAEFFAGMFASETPAP